MSDLAPIIVCVFIRNQFTGKYLFGKRKGTGHGDGLWALAGGHVQKEDLSLEKAVNRESMEETNLMLDHIRFLYQKYYHYPEKGGMMVMFYHAEIALLSKRLYNQEPHKCEWWDWFDLESNPPMPCMEPLGILPPFLQEIIFEGKK